MVKTYKFSGYTDGVTDNPRALNLNKNTTLEANYKEVIDTVEYNPSEATILVHAKPAATSTILIVSPTEIGTTTTPLAEGTIVNVYASLKDVNNNLLSGKTIHLYNSTDTELTTGVTDAIGKVTLTYTVSVADDGKNVKVKYLGD